MSLVVCTTDCLDYTPIYPLNNRSPNRAACWLLCFIVGAHINNGFVVNGCTIGCLHGRITVASMEY